MSKSSFDRNNNIAVTVITVHNAHALGTCKDKQGIFVPSAHRFFRSRGLKPRGSGEENANRISRQNGSRFTRLLINLE